MFVVDSFYCSGISNSLMCLFYINIISIGRNRHHSSGQNVGHNNVYIMVGYFNIK